MIKLILALFVSSAWAHDFWISREHLIAPDGSHCCGPNDCQVEKVEETIGGFKVRTGEIIPYSQVIWKSQDGHWWRCRKYLVGGQEGTRCLIGPPPST